MKFGERLRLLRKNKNLTLRELEEKTDISYSALGKYERDERQPDFETLAKIADYFDVSVDWLLGRFDDQYDTPGYRNAVKIIDNVIQKIDTDNEVYIPPVLLNDIIEEKIDESQISLVPVFAVLHGQLQLTEENILNYEFKYKNEISDEDFFYILAPDDSMKGANIVRGSKILCRKLKSANVLTFDSGKIYLVSYQDVVYVRRVFINEHKQVTLQAENIQFPPIVIQNNKSFKLIATLELVEFNPNDL